MRRSLLLGVVAALVFAALPAAHAAAAEPVGELIDTSVAGNIDDVTGDEVFTVHSVEADPGSIDYTVEVALRRGTDGSLLWSREFPSGSITVVPARVGTDGARGMYVLVRRYNYFVEINTTSDGVSILTPVPLLYGGTSTGYDIYAVTAAGDVLWEDHVTYTPDQGNPGRSLNAPLALAVANATPSAATDVALVLGDAPTVITEVNSGETTVRIVVFDGADGSEAVSGSLGQVDFGILDMAVTDLDGDHLDDFVVNVPGDRVQAVRGTDGQSLWSSPGAFNTLELAADLTGDGIRELLASTTSFGTTSLPGVARVIGGKAGVTRFEFEADAAWPTADGAAGALRLNTSETAGYEFDYYDRVGSNTRHRDAIVQRSGQPNASMDLGRVLGDINGNGSQDRSYTVTVGNGSDDTVLTEVIDGATFATLWSGAPIGQPLYAGRTGAGDDLALVEPFGKYAVDVSLQDGATGSSQWMAHLVPDADETTFSQVSAGDFNGDGAMDVLVALDTSKAAQLGTVPENLGNNSNYTEYMYVLHGGTGTTLWSR